MRQSYCPQPEGIFRETIFGFPSSVTDYVHHCGSSLHGLVAPGGARA